MLKSGCRCYIGNLPYKTTETELRRLFEQYGKVTDVKIVMDRETDRSKGFGFISFETPEEAQRAIKEMDGYNLDNRALRVNEAEERSSSPRTNSNYRPDVRNRR